MILKTELKLTSQDVAKIIKERFKLDHAAVVSFSVESVSETLPSKFQFAGATVEMCLDDTDLAAVQTNRISRADVFDR